VVFPPEVANEYWRDGGEESARTIALKGRDCAFEGFAQNPAFAVGDGVEPIDGLGPRLDIDLDISAGAVPPRLACER
jgi:hypothetical protein